MMFFYFVQVHLSTHNRVKFSTTNRHGRYVDRYILSEHVTLELIEH